MQLTRETRRKLTVTLVVIASFFVASAAGYARYLQSHELPDAVLRALEKKTKPESRPKIRRTPTGPRGSIEDFFRDAGDSLGHSTRTTSVASSEALGAPDLEMLARSVPFSMQLTRVTPLSGRSQTGSGPSEIGGGGSRTPGGLRLPWGRAWGRLPRGSVSTPPQGDLGPPSEGAPLPAPEPSAPLLFFSGCVAVAYALRGRCAAKR